MSVKAFAKPGAAAKATPVKSGNGKAIQRKLLPGLFTPSIVQRKQSSGNWVHHGSLKPVNNRSLVQPKVKVHAADDHYEKEADLIADKVMSNDKSVSPAKVTRVSRAAQRKCTSCEKEDAAVQAMHVQRKCSSCDQKDAVQAKNKKSNSTTFHSSDSGPPVSSQHNTNNALESVLGNQSTRGSPLPDDTRSFMESRMGADLSNVRIHTSQSSHEASTSIGARAFTHGANIHFANGEFNPQTKPGRQLLAHELAHTMQQGAVPEKAPSKTGSSVKGLRKVVPKAKHEKKIARLSNEFDNKESSRKKAGGEFAAKFKGKKGPKLSADALKKGKGKKGGKDPPLLPGKEKKKPGKPAKPVTKAVHLQSAKNQQAGISQLASGGIKFRPHEDKKLEEDPAQKKQSSLSKNISENVLQKAAGAATSMHGAISRIRPRLMQSAVKAISRIKTNEAQQKEKIKTTIKEQKLAAKKAMQSAAGSINGYHKKVTGDLKAAATKARAEILVAKTLNTVLIELAAILQIPKINKAYEDAKKDFAAKGSSVGSDCYSSQSQRSWNNFISKMKHEDDNIFDGPYTDDMKQARGDAAVKVGEGYKESMVNAGAEQAAGIDAGKPNDLKKVDDSKAEMLKGLNSMYDDSLKGINAGETAGLSQADSTKKSMLANVYKQHKTAQSQLDTTEKTQLQMTEILALKQSQQVELQANQATESMEEGGYQSLMHLHNGFKEYKQVCESMNSPPPAILQQKLKPIEDSLATSAPAMSASLQKGMMQTENGFNKTATETITTTNTTVTQTLAESKLTNDKAIDGLNKLRSAAVSALQGILNNNKKTITETASTCVTNIQNIKTAFDGSLTAIQGDLDSGLKAGSLQFKEGLEKAVASGTPDNGNKGMLAYSIEQENEAADKVEPRWKSVVKILIVIAVVLVVALVVGPAVIGFIGAAAGGGAFGTAVGAVVGGAILGAGSSAVITVSNNLLDGKKWDTGLKEAMIEGAVTGAIGGAFGAAGSGIAGKLIGVAAKGVGPALGRFAITQTVDFAGNVVTEYASSKLQGKPFSWTAVAQGQATGVGMNIGMGGLSSLKNVKGFKTINSIGEGATNLGNKFNSKITGKPMPVSAPHPTAPKTGVEEPHSTTPKAGDEPVKTTPKEDIAPSKTAPTEDPHPTGKPTEEPHGGTKPVEEPKTTAPKEDVAPSKPKEDGAPSKPKEDGGPSKATPEEKKPSNLSKEEIDDGIVAKHPTPDGHNMKVTENGMLVKCSTCELLDMKYAKDFQDPKNQKFKEEFEKIKAMPDADAKAKAAADFDESMTQSMIDEYKANNKSTTLSDAEIRARLNDGKRMNPETKRLGDTERKPAPKPEIEAKHKTDSNGKTVEESFDTQKANSKEAAEVKKAHEERAKAKEDKDKLTKGTEEYNDKNKEMIDKSEKMGEASADAYMKEKYGVEPEYTGSGSRTVDKMYVKDGKVYVVEAKGGSSDLGTKVSTDGPTSGKVLEQGTREYLEQTIKEMKASALAAKNDPKVTDKTAADKKLAAATKMEAALKSGDLVYLHASQKVGPNGELVPATVKEFDID